MSDVEAGYTSVKVICPVLVGSEATCEESFAAAHADEFDPGVLTITANHMREYVMKVYPPDRWIRAVVYDLNGYPLADFRNTPVAEERKTA